MGLPSTLATLVASAVLIPLDAARVRNNINRNVERMEREGAFYTHNLDVHLYLTNAIEINWTHEDRSFYPEKLIPFFEEYPEARRKYAEALTAEATVAAGYKPWTYGGSFNRFTYDPYGGYKRFWKEEEDEWRREHFPEEVAEEERVQRENEARIDAILAAEDRKAIVLLVIFGVFIVSILVYAIAS